ncbi:MAG: glycosyltransferase family 4 protein [Clostridia bacterium]|nr:glycosyltransferase family 4 protein [Clostridia bacterium]
MVSGNVLHICNFSAAYKGNFIKSLLALENQLLNKGIHQVYLFPARARRTDAQKWIEELKKEGHIIYIQETSFKENLKLFQKIKKEHHIETVFRHFANYKTDIFTWLIFGRKKIIRFFHCEYSPDNFPKFQIKKFVYRREILVGVSKAVSKQIEKYFPHNKSVTVENAIDFTRLDNPEEFHSKPGISCMAMGYNPLVKGADLAIKAVAELQKKNNIHLYIVAASHLEELKETISEVVGISPDWLTILPPNENIATYYSNTDIFLAPSRSEGFSYAVVEATYCKSAIVLSDIPAHQNLKVNKKYMFKSEDIADFCEKLQTAIDELSSTQSFKDREEAKNNVIKSYGLDRWCEEVCRLI